MNCLKIIGDGEKTRTKWPSLIELNNISNNISARDH